MVSLRFVLNRYVSGCLGSLREHSFVRSVVEWPVRIYPHRSKHKPLLSACGSFKAGVRWSGMGCELFSAEGLRTQIGTATHAGCSFLCKIFIIFTKPLHNFFISVSYTECRKSEFGRRIL